MQTMEVFTAEQFIEDELFTGPSESDVILKKDQDYDLFVAKLNAKPPHIRWPKWLEMHGLHKGKEYCPVRKKEVTVFEIPIDCIELYRGGNQPRMKDCNPSDIEELATQLRYEGLDHAICCLDDINEAGESILRLVWGNHRLRACARLKQFLQVEAKNLGFGMIRFSFYEENRSDLKDWCSLENNLHKKAVPASSEDNYRAVVDAIDRGKCDQIDQTTGEIIAYSDLEVGPRRAAVFSYCSKWLGNWGKDSGKRNWLWKKLGREHTASRNARTSTFEKPYLIKYFNKANDYGVELSTAQGSGQVFTDANGIKYVVYLMVKSNEFAGALDHNIIEKLLRQSKADKVIVIACLNDVSSTGLKQARDTRIEYFDKWYDCILDELVSKKLMTKKQRQRSNMKLVHRILYMPQSRKEIDEHMDNNTWAVDHTF